LHYTSSELDRMPITEFYNLVACLEDWIADMQARG
jgi:hypothetical protein